MIHLTRYELKQLVEMAHGGEAIIYKNPSRSGILYRIYIDYQKRDLSAIEAKTKYFISIKNKLPKEVVGPEDTIYIEGVFAGYTMISISNGKDIDELSNEKFVAINKVTNKHSMMVMKRVNEVFQELHKLGILIGDVSGNNVMIDIAKIVKQNVPAIFFIDVASWGVDGMFPPSAYTKEYTCPDSYMPDGTIKFSKKNENYALAVLNFLVLTRIHPFGGIYHPQPRMRKKERMKNNLSILGPARERGEVGINDNLPSYDWMSPELKQHFLEIFEQGRRDEVFIDDIESLYNNLKLCNVHKAYYDGRFNECPLCNSKATVVKPVVVQNATAGGDITATCVFSLAECNIILNKYLYVDTNGFIVHRTTGKKFEAEAGIKTQFSKDGRFVFMSDENEIVILNVSDGKKISVLQCAYRSMNLVSGDYFYYVDISNALRKVKVTLSGVMSEFVAYVHNAVFDVEEDGKFCAVSLYLGKAMVDINGYRFDIKCPNYIKKYAIKRDSQTPQWLFIYKDDKNDEYHTWLLKDSKVAEEVMIGYDYSVGKLSNVTIHSGTIYIPDENKIIGISTKTGKSKEFMCGTPGILSQDSAIEFIGTRFRVTNRNKEYELM